MRKLTNDMLTFNGNHLALETKSGFLVKPRLVRLSGLYFRKKSRHQLPKFNELCNMYSFLPEMGSKWE